MHDIFSIRHAALEAFREQSPRIISETASRALARENEVALHGEEARHVVASSLEFTVRLMDAAMACGESALLEDQLLWALDRLPNDGVSIEHVLSRLALLREVTMELMPKVLAVEIAAVVEWTEQRLSELAAERAKTKRA
jgi:hypothetical protein